MSKNRPCVLGLDVGANSVGSAWIDHETGQIACGTSIFPAGVEEADEKRGDPKNAKRRAARRTRITLRRRAERKRKLRLKLIRSGLLPADESTFKTLLERSDPWDLRRRGLDEPLTPYEFGRVLLHIAQRRGALGIRTSEEEAGGDSSATDDGKVKKSIEEVKTKIQERNARTFGEFIAMLRDERRTPIGTMDKRPTAKRKGLREWRKPVRNKGASYEHCADREMIRDEFATLWNRQKEFGRETAPLLTDELRAALDRESSDGAWRRQGLLFGQRRATWDVGALGRCPLHPDERCVPHADMYASRYLVVETVNNLRIVERGKEERPLTAAEREKILAYLSGPLGTIAKGKYAGRPKRTVSATDLRLCMGDAKEGWGKPAKNSRFRFNIERDEDRPINTDWFSREVVHGAIGLDSWKNMEQSVREGLNRALLKFDPDDAEDERKLKHGVMDWAKLNETQAEALVAAWKTRPKPDSKRLKMGRRAVRNLLALMDRPEPWPDPDRPERTRWLTQIEARRMIAADPEFIDATTSEPLNERDRRRYATGTKGATARDRYYLSREKHWLRDDNGEVIRDEAGKPLPEPPPAPLLGNPVVRKAIHEVRRHLIEYMTAFRRRPDQVYVELAREARMGKEAADRLLSRNRLRNRIRAEIVREFELESKSTTQQRCAVQRVLLCVQQNGVCPLCGNQRVPTKITPRMAANGQDCEIAHIIPRACGGGNGFSNLVLAHTACNREMGRRTPRDYWTAAQEGGFEAAMQRVEAVFTDVERIKFSENRAATGEPLWKLYFNKRDDQAKLAQFKKDVKDVQGMTAPQLAATQYAARQLMSYLADALYDGQGLSELGGERRIFAVDGLWTSRLRREWNLLFDPHNARSHLADPEEEGRRKEKDRGDHRHHAVDAVAVALCTQQVRNAWESRERQAEADHLNTADEERMANYRRDRPLNPPPPFASREELREKVKRAVFGDGETEKPVCHRPAKRKIVGPLHEDTLFGPVVDESGGLTELYTARKSILELKPAHLRLPRPETDEDAVKRLAAERMAMGMNKKSAKAWAKAHVASPAYQPRNVDPPPEKSGIVRDPALRRRLRQCLEEAGLDPDNFSKHDVKRLALDEKFQHASGVPIRSFVLLRTMKDPVVVRRKRPDYATGRLVPDEAPASQRAYVGGNNHHIEIRENEERAWSGRIVSMYEAAQRLTARYAARRAAGVPKPAAFRKLSKVERAKWSPALRRIDREHPIVDRRDDPAKGGRFVMSLCEGETLYMRHKERPEEVGYFVVVKLDKPQTVQVSPHWDARKAGERKDAEGGKVPNSQREQFAVTPTDLKELAAPGFEHAVKVRVGVLGKATVLKRD